MMIPPATKHRRRQQGGRDHLVPGAGAEIREVKTGKFARLFRNNGTYNEREIVVIPALRVKTSRAIVQLLASKPSLSNKQIAGRLWIKVSSAHRYLSDLASDRIVRFETNDGLKTYFPESDVYDIIVKAGRQSSANRSD